MSYETPKLPYAYNALEPYIDEQTMMIHHDKHHAAYTTKFNAALEGVDVEGKTAEDILKDLSIIPEEKKQAVINNGGGHVNHTLFWELLKKDVPAKGEVVDAIVETFGSLEAFKEAFSNAAATRFGSGWAWLVLNNGTLEIMSTANQDSPLSQGKTPLIGLDVWEHGYYITYKQDRLAYIKAFWNIINWEKVNELYEKNK